MYGYAFLEISFTSDGANTITIFPFQIKNIFIMLKIGSIVLLSDNILSFWHFLENIFHTFKYFLQNFFSETISAIWRKKNFLDTFFFYQALYFLYCLVLKEFLIFFYFSLFPMISIQSWKWKTALSITNLLVLLRRNSRNLLMHMTL